MDYLKSFIIGSSLPVTISFLLGVMKSKHKNYSYESYSLMAPIYFGLMNILALYLSKKYEWSLKQRLLYISILSAILVPSLAWFIQSYDMNIYKWVKYVVRVMINHLITYNLIIYFLEQNI